MDSESSQVYLVTEVHGVWGSVFEVPGTAKLNPGDDAWMNQISCSSVGNCGAAGYFSVAYDFGIMYCQPFVINEVGGKWSNAIQVPGIKALPLTDGQVASANAISCPAPDRCTVGGYRDYASTGTDAYAFVDSQSWLPQLHGQSGRRHR
jgi:hypothetical protein